MNFNFTNFKNLGLRRLIGGLLLLAISLSMFAAPVGVNAAEGQCFSNRTDRPVTGISTSGECTVWGQANGGSTWVEAKDGKAVETSSDPEQNGIEQSLDSCGVFGIFGKLVGCIEQIVYVLFVSVPSLFMGIAAHIFNFMTGLTLSSKIYGMEFIQTIWKVVRDFANIFFILILLYAAFQIMLDLGHGGGKKIIAAVILIALLVNFSLFFTKIVIDASNIVALIFYNRIKVEGNNDYKSTADASKTGVPEKNTAGALISRFKIGTFFSDETITKLKESQAEELKAQYTVLCPTCNQAQVERAALNNAELSPLLLIGIMLAYGIVAFALAYAFLIVGIVFLGRLIGLIAIMIISPLAFVSYSVPKLKGIKTIGFDSWIKQLFSVAFVAAIFMFILYLISEVMQADIFKNYSDTKQGLFGTLILVFVPAILIVIFLLKGAKYAKEASGEFTGAIITGAKMLGGVALGAATGGAAFLGTQIPGRIGMGVASSEKRREVAVNAEGKYSKWQQTRAKMALGVGNFLGNRSYDVRQVGLAKTVASKAGIKLADKGLGPLGTKTFEKGRRGQIERRIDKEQEKIKTTVLLTKLGEKNQDDRHGQWQKDTVQALNVESEKRKDRFQPFADEDKKKFAETFTESYKAGGDLSKYGLNKKVEAGSVGIAADVNEDRREAYAAGLAKGGVLAQAMRGLLGGMGKMIPAGAGVAAAGVIAGGAAAGAVGAGALVMGGGFWQMLRDGLDRIDKSTLQVAAAVRKPPPANKEIADLLKKIAGGEKVSEDRLSDISRKMSGLGKSGEGEKGGGEEHK